MAKKYHTVSSSQPLSGGREMVTERKIPCTSGCTYCKSDRKPSRVSDLDFSQAGGRYGSPSTLDERLPTPYHFDFKPAPRPERERRKEKRPSSRDYYYSDGGRVEDYGLRRSNSLHGPSQPIPIPPRRSNTMHEDDRWRDSGDRPRVMQRGHSRKESGDVPLGFYDLLYNHGAGSSRHGDRDRYAVKDSRYAESIRTKAPRRRSESPMEIRYKDDDYYRERPALRRKPKIIQQDNFRPEVMYGSSPVVGSFDSSSYGSRRPSTSYGASQSPPKSVRWGDDPRAAQNAKINNRAPKLSRSATIAAGAGTGTHAAGDVKSILKRAGDDGEPAAATTTAPAVQDLSRDQYEALYRSAAGIGADDRATSPQRRAKEEGAAAAARDALDSAGMIEGLRRRMNGSRGQAAGPSGEMGGRDRRYSFDMPPRRFSTTGAYGEKASSRGRRPEVFYDDSRRDWY